MCRKVLHVARHAFLFWVLWVVQEKVLVSCVYAEKTEPPAGLLGQTSRSLVL